MIMMKHSIPSAGKTAALSGAVAALYVVLTMLSRLAGLDSGVIQLRFSEALTVLPFFLPGTVPGLFIGCLLSNLLAGCLPLDIAIGSGATLLGALGTAWLGRKKAPLWTAPIPPVLCNTALIPPVLAYVYHASGALPVFFLPVFAGEFLSCFVLGLLLAGLLRPVISPMARRP